MTFKTLKTLLATAALIGSALAVHAQDYPTRPITLVLPAPPAGATDAIARVMAEEMAQRLRQPVIVDNKPGGAGMLGVQTVARAAPDGYTLLLTHAAPIAYVPHMAAKVGYDVQRDLAPITEICSASLLFVVTPDVPARSMKEFIAWAAQRKGKVNYGSYGSGSASHLMSAYLSESHQLDMTHVPYKGEAPMTQDLLAGQVQAGIGTLGTVGPHVASGKLRALAVIGDQRLASIPNVPTMAEAGLPDAEYRPTGALMLMAPAGTPAAVVARVEKVAREVIQQSATLKARFQAYGLVAVGNSAEEFRQNLASNLPMFKRLIKSSGASMD